jgi:diacylglycerol kinase family enzyme
MAVELGIPQRINNALESILTAKSKNIDVLEINNQYISMHLSDIGMNARIIKRFEKEGVRGLYGYTKQFFKELRRPKRFYCTITIDGKTYTEKTLMVVLANATTYGTRAVVNPTGKLDDGKFEIVIIKPYPKWYIFKMFIAFFTGNLDKLRKVKILQGKECKINLSKPHELQIDGELVGEQREVVAKILKYALRILVPK